MAVKLPDAKETRLLQKWWRRGVKSAPSPAIADRPQEKARLSPFQALKAAARRRYSRADIVLFTSGIALSAVCAFFPWYVFLNQDQFGVRAVKLDMPSTGSISTGVAPAGRVAGPVADLSKEDDALDTFTTGTLAEPSAEEEEIEKQAVEQPFPALIPEFEVVHVANGRAMIADDQGLFVVQRGSLLPDNTKVASIEQRNGRWVVVTSADRVLEIAPK